MIHEDYPALYRAADTAANNAQSSLLRLHKANSFLLVLAAVSTLVSTMDQWLAIGSAALFLASLGCYVYGENKNFQEQWYQARALAESIKTSTWRLMMKAEPFKLGSEQKNLDKFRSLLSELLQQNRGLGESLGGDWGKHDQVTPEILKFFRLSFIDKKGRYLKERIEDQREWYSCQSQANKSGASSYFRRLVLIYSGAIFLLLIRIGNPSVNYLPIEVLAVLASSMISWTQLKRFRELASAYGLTAHEVGIIQSKFSAVSNDIELSAFVSDAENAFSREHTQWAARRDH